MTIGLTLRPLTLATLLAASFSAAPALAQDLLLSPDPMAQARAAMARNDPAEALSRYLRVLAARPKDLDDARDVLAVQGPETLDMPYIENWCAVHATTGRLEKILDSLPPL